MQLRQLFNRKVIAVIALLVIILLSINSPIPDFSTLFHQELNLNKATNYLCITEDLPQDVPVYFFGNPYDPAANSNTIALYYRAQYFLAPRLLHLTSILDREIEDREIQWFIGTNLDGEQAERISEDFRLNALKECGALYLFESD